MNRCNLCPPITIEELSRIAYENAKSQGFHANDPTHNDFTKKEWVDRIAVFLTNLHGEISELWEATRKGMLNNPCDKGVNLSNLEEELADIIIRTCDTAKTLGVNLDYAVQRKHEYNRTREFMHGKKA